MSVNETTAAWSPCKTGSCKRARQQSAGQQGSIRVIWDEVAQPSKPPPEEILSYSPLGGWVSFSSVGWAMLVLTETLTRPRLLESSMLHMSESAELMFVSMLMHFYCYLPRVRQRCLLRVSWVTVNFGLSRFLMAPKGYRLTQTKATKAWLTVKFEVIAMGYMSPSANSSKQVI